MKPISIIATAAALAGLAGVAQATTAAFDDLAGPPVPAAATSLSAANSGSDSYAGVVWDSRFVVVGDQYRVDPPSGPLFGLPHSGHYFVTNADGADGLTMTTTQVLTSAWFGQNAYYGFGNGADRITVSALQDSNVLGSAQLDLQNANPGQPSQLQRMDTSAFLALSGITGYRIDRRAPGQYLDNWVGDSFVFQSPVPEPSSAWLLVLGLAGLAWPCAVRRLGHRSGCG